MKGITELDRTNEFASGVYRIVEGRNIDKSDKGKAVAVINQKLAKMNTLKLNSKIEMQSLSNPKLKTTYTVIGIYNADADCEFEGIVGSDPTDTIYVPLNTLRTFYLEPDKADPESALSATYYIDSPENVSSFIAASKKFSGMEDFTLTADTSLYTRVTSSLKSATKLSSLMTIIMLAAGSLILALIIALSLKGRRREFGILLAVGEKRARIILQVFAETLIPMAIAFCIAIFVSGFITQKVTDKLVTDSVTAVQQQDKVNSTDLAYLHKRYDKMFLNPDTDCFDTDLASPVSKVNVAVTPAVIGEFAGCGLLIVLVSILFPAVKVLRLSPMVILTKKE